MNRYYAVLGLPTTASKDEVKRAYRKLVLIWHPDKNSSPGAAAKFMQITEAYDVLMGERPAPREYTYTRTNTRTYAATAARPKTRKEQEQEKRSQRDDQLREKFENMRAHYLRASDFQKRKNQMYFEVKKYFFGAGAVVVLAIALPLTILDIANLIWTIPVAIGGGLRLLWTGGRIKLRADMIYSGKTNYTIADIREFFMDTTGFRFQPPGGGSRWR